MNVNDGPDLHASRFEQFPHKEETHSLIGCAFEVLNTLGPGLNEKCYENALVVEFRLQAIGYTQQHHFDVLYKGVNVGVYIPDIVAFGSVIVDAKTIDTITDYERGQMLNYLRITKLRLWLIFNFEHPKLGWERVTLTPTDI